MKTILFAIFILLTNLLNAASYTSVMNGDWSNPFTWGETTVIPLPGDEVTINHTVTITDQYTVNGYWSVDGASASITIGSTGILQTGNNVLGIAILNGGSIINNGQLNIPQLGNYLGSFTNNGTSSLSQLIYNLSNIENNGDILDIDSLYTSGTFLNNTADAVVYSDSLYIEGTFLNNGSLYLHEMTNNGDFINQGNIEFRRMTNLSQFDNYNTLSGEFDATNSGNFKLWTGSTFDLLNNFSNIDSVNHDALFTVEGIFNIGNNFYNADTIKGIDGQINVLDSTMNAGWFKETFYFCDATPSATAPFIDFNTGNIESGIRYCTSVDITFIGEEKMSFCPNPANTTLHVDGVDKIKIFDISGKLITAKFSNKKSTVDVSHLEKGIYLVSLTRKGNSSIKRLIIE